MSSPDDLVAALTESIPGIRIEKEVLGSGVAWINVWHGTDFVTIEYSRAHEFGVSLVSDEDPGFGGHERVFTDASQVLVYVQQLLLSPH